MANYVTIAITKFVDLDKDGNEVGEPTYGFRVYDSNGGDYSNTYTREELFGKSFFEIVELARALSDTGNDLIEWAEACQPGIFFGENFITWEEVRATQKVS